MKSQAGEVMKQVLSISLGSASRDHQSTVQLGGQTFLVERRGVNGDKQQAIQLIQKMDGKVAAFGLGGTDLYIYAGNRRYTFRESAQIAAAAKLSPIVDGSGIKNTLERWVITYLSEQAGIDFSRRKVLVVCAVDRFGMAQALVKAGSQVVFGDLMFGLGWPVPLRTLESLSHLARFVAPVITKLPIHWFYPIGEQQTKCTPKFSAYFTQADIIAGDFHFIKRYMPYELPGKTVITNTVTREDIEMLAARGVNRLVTTTPDMGGRSFGTNTLEALLIAYAGKKTAELSPADYQNLIERLKICPRIVDLT